MISHSHFTHNAKHEANNILSIREQSIANIIRDIDSGTIWNAKAKNESNMEYILQYQQILSTIGTPKRIESKRLLIPTFPKIQIQKSDTKGIKEFIRKINFKTQTHDCNHTTQDRQFDKFEADLAKIFLCDEMRIIEKYVKCVAECILRLLNSDNLNCSSVFRARAFENPVLEKHYFELVDSKTRNNPVVQKLGPSGTMYDLVESMRLHMICVNAKLTELESFFKSVKCHKCSKVSKEYSYGLELIQEMRDEVQAELEESELLRAEHDANIAEDKYAIKPFMKKHYPNLERIPLMDIVNKYYDIFGLKKKQDEMKDMLESTGKYKVKNVSRKYYVVRI
jgi:hypothetical protein